MARVFVILYIVNMTLYYLFINPISVFYEWKKHFDFLLQAVLHLWVMIVLLTYTPEMHHGHPAGR